MDPSSFMILALSGRTSHMMTSFGAVVLGEKYSIPARRAVKAVNMENIYRFLLDISLEAYFTFMRDYGNGSYSGDGADPF